MEIYERKSKFSEIEIFNDSIFSEEISTKIHFDNTIAVCLIDKFIIIEYIKPEKWNLYCNEKTEVEIQEKQKKANEELENALDTTLNTDPFGGVHNGQKLGEIYKNDRKWFDRAVKELRNQFILDRIKIILKELEN